MAWAVGDCLNNKSLLWKGTEQDLRSVCLGMFYCLEVSLPCHSVFAVDTYEDLFHLDVTIDMCGE